MPDTDSRVKVIDAIFRGIKELILACAALATIWVQLENKGKLDTAAAKTEVVESKLEATTLQSQAKMAAIAAAAEASVKNWKAYTTKDPNDMNEAEAAIAAAERGSK